MKTGIFIKHINNSIIHYLIPIAIKPHIEVNPEDNKNRKSESSEYQIRMAF